MHKTTDDFAKISLKMFGWAWGFSLTQYLYTFSSFPHTRGRGCTAVQSCSVIMLFVWKNFQNKHCSLFLISIRRLRMLSGGQLKVIGSAGFIIST